MIAPGPEKEDEETITSAPVPLVTDTGTPNIQQELRVDLTAPVGQQVPLPEVQATIIDDPEKARK